jgi:hypothetical protein
MGDVAGTVDDPIEIDIENPEFRRALRKKYRELDVEVNGTRATASSPHQRCEQDVGTSQATDPFDPNARLAANKDELTDAKKKTLSSMITKADDLNKNGTSPARFASHPTHVASPLDSSEAVENFQNRASLVSSAFDAALRAPLTFSAFLSVAHRIQSRRPASSRWTRLCTALWRSPAWRCPRSSAARGSTLRRSW